VDYPDLKDQDREPLQTEGESVEVTPRQLFAGERHMAQEQIAAAWQLHVESLQDQLERGWRDHVRRALDERFDSLEAAFEQEVESRVAERMDEENARTIAVAMRALTERLNQTARRLDQAETTDAWAAALLDGVFAFASRAVLFSLIKGELQYEDHRTMGTLDLSVLENARLPITHAPAFGSAVETMDAVICVASPGELSEDLAAVLGVPPEKRVCLLPVIIGQSEKKRRVAAILYAEGNGEPVDINVLEVITAMAGAALDAHQSAQRVATAAPAGAIMSIAPVIPIPGGVKSEAPAAGETPDWEALNREEQELHARAQRFARVRVAEMRLYQAQSVRRGREDGRLYQALRGEMDRGRAQFKHEFMHVPSMIDYFHLELVRTLANDDPTLLGPEYPGPLA